MEADRHEFGSQHTLQKLRMLEKYLPAYTTALKFQRFKLHYIDAFAGTGNCDIKVGPSDEDRVSILGSAQIAMKCLPPFHRMVFVEQNKRHVDALRAMTDRYVGRAVDIFAGDANLELPRILRALDVRHDRAVVFLDPYGMNLYWDTLVEVARTKLADVWYLFPLSGMYRQAARDAADIDEDKAAALTRMLGTDAWRTEFYREKRQVSLFGEEPGFERTAGPMQMLDWVTEKLGTTFAGLEGPKIFYQTMPNGSIGAPLFGLYFLVSNDSPRAVGLAKKIARDIFKHPM